MHQDEEGSLHLFCAHSAPAEWVQKVREDVLRQLFAHYVLPE